MSQSSAFKSKRAGRWVTIRLKVLFSILITLICVFLVINFVVEPIITGNIAQQEKEDTEGKVRQAQAVLLNELSDLSNVAEGWASWDDTYAFAINNSEGYIKSNLHENTFINNRLNLILIANTDGRTVWGGTYDRIQSKLIPVPSVLLDCLTQLNLDSKAKLAGIITPGNEPLMIAVFPILTSKGEGPMHGRLIFGRSLDETEIEHLSRVSRLAIGILPLNAPDIPSEVLALPKSGGGEPVVIRPVDRNNIRGYSILDNIEGEKALVLSVDVSRTIYSSGQTMLRQFKMVLLVISGVYLLISFMLLELFVVSPITSLSQNVIRIQPDGGENRVPIRGNDEVATLGNSINQMLDKLDESRKTLADSEEKYHTLVENAPVGISIAASDGHSIERNKALQEMHGYDSKEEFMKMSAADFYYDAADWKRFIELAARVPVQDFEVRHKRKDGSSFWVSQTSIPNTAESSEQQFIVIVQDITERKKAEEALKVSEERFRSLLENAPVGITVTIPNGGRFEANKALVKMQGFSSREELLAAPVADIYYDPNDRKILLTLLEKGPVQNYEMRRKRKDGSVFWASLSSSFYTDSFGEKLLISVIADITERKQAEEALRVSEKRYRLLAENATDVIWTTDISDPKRLTYISPSVTHLLGYSPEEAMSIEMEDVFTPASFELAMKTYADEMVRETRQIAPFKSKILELDLRRKDGSIVPIDVQFSLVRESDGRPATVLSVARDATQRKRDEEALRTSEERFRNLVENAPIGISITTQDGRGILRNRAIQQMHGYESKEEFMKITASQRYYDMEDRKRLLELLDKQGEVSDFEVRFKRQDGSLFWGSITVIHQIDKSGERQLITITQDITERKNAETRYATIIQTAIDGFWIIDLKGRFLECNDSYCSMIGYTREELLRMSIPDIEVMETTEETVKHINKIIQQGYERFETKHRCKDGKIIDLEISAKYSILGKGQIFVFIRDITERKQVEGENLLKGTLLDAATDSIVLRELNNGVPGRPFYANEAAYQTRGYTREEFMAMSINELVVPEMVSSTEFHINNILIKGENVWESVHKLKDGTLMPVEIHAKTITRDQRNYMLSVVRDITRRKLAEEERNKLYQREKELRERLEDEIKKRTEFTRALVHELKTPLTPVLASSDLLVEELHEEPYLSLAKNINRGAVNLNSRIDELLDLARAEIGTLHLNLKQTDIARLLGEVIEYMAPYVASTHRTISLKKPDFLPEAMADEERVRQVLLNFISNSVKYSDPGSEILVIVDVEGDELVLRVRDSGHGMDENEKGRLFQPYYRLEGDRDRLSGLGLGLALSKTLVELHGGKIWVDSKKGEGSTFSFSIPFIKDPADTSKQESAL